MEEKWHAAHGNAGLVCRGAPHGAGCHGRTHDSRRSGRPLLPALGGRRPNARTPPPSPGECLKRDDVIPPSLFHPPKNCPCADGLRPWSRRRLTCFPAEGLSTGWLAPPGCLRCCWCKQIYRTAGHKEVQHRRLDDDKEWLCYWFVDLLH